MAQDSPTLALPTDATAVARPSLLHSSPCARLESFRLHGGDEVASVCLVVCPCKAWCPVEGTVVCSGLARVVLRVPPRAVCQDVTESKGPRSDDEDGHGEGQEGTDAGAARRTTKGERGGAGMIWERASRGPGRMMGRRSMRLRVFFFQQALAARASPLRRRARSRAQAPPATRSNTPW